MEALLINFGDNDRVIPDINSRHATIKIGQCRKIDLDEAAIKFIRKAMSTDTLIIVEDMSLLTPEMTTLMGLLHVIDTDPYDQLLQKVCALLGRKNMPQANPTRIEIRLKLRQVAFDVAQGKATSITEAADKKLIHDDVDPKELEKDRRRQEDPPARDPNRPRPSKDEMDKALGIETGKDDGPEGKEGAPPAPKRKAAAAEPAKSPRQRVRPQMAAKSASRNKNRQTDAADKPAGRSGRVRA